jgi:phosphoglycerol transferase
VAFWEKKRMQTQWLVALAAGVTSTIGFASLTHVYSIADLKNPLEYFWDSVCVMAVVQSAADRGLASLTGGSNHWLGFPSEARWNDFPLEDSLFLPMGYLARWVGTIAAVNLSFWLATVLNAVSLSWVARRLRCSTPFAIASGLLFAFLPFVHYRSTSHFALVVYFHVPLQVLILLWASSARAIPFGSSRYKFGAAVSVISALLATYHFNFFIQGLLLLTVLKALSQQWKSALATASLITLGMFTFMLNNLDTILFSLREGVNLEAAHRNLTETIIYGLRPMELLIPSQWHRIKIFSDIGAAYVATAPMVGEFPSMSLGLVPGISFIALILFGLRTAFLRSEGLAKRLSLLSIWLMFVSIGGGLMHLAQTLLGIVVFRSNNRVSVLLGACALLFLASVLTHSLRSKSIAWIVAMLLGTFGLWEQSPDQTKRQSYQNGLGHWAMMERWSHVAPSDEQFVAALESTLPNDSGILQLPATAFPEAGGNGQWPDYDHFRLYVHSHQKLRFSYGAIKGRPEAKWQFEMAGLDPATLVLRAKESGVGAIVFSTKVYSADAISTVSQAAQAISQSTTLSSEAGDWVAITLK